MSGVIRLRPVRGVLAAAVVLGALAVAPGAPVPSASAGGAPGVEVSLDGTHFAREPAGPLFADPPLIVPGDVVVATLWVRNATPYDGALRLSGTEAWASSPALAESLGVSARETGDAQTPGVPQTPGVAFTAAAGCALVFAGPVLAPGEQTSLQVALTFDPSTPDRAGADAQANLDFVVTLRDPADSAASGTADCASGQVVPAFPTGDGGGSEGIALTGQDVLPMIVLGAGFLVAGLLTVLAFARSNRRRRERSPRP